MMCTLIVRFCSDSFSKYFSTICCYTYINLLLVAAIRGEKLNAKPGVLFKTYILLDKKHNANISGWPSTVPFSSPSLITSIPLMHTLYDAWSGGAAHWVMLAAKQLVTFLTNAKSCLGDQPVKVRKQRSNKNKKRKQPDEGESGDEDGENGNKVTKLKKSKTTSTKSTTRKPHCNVKVPLRSRSVIDDSNKEEGS